MPRAGRLGGHNDEMNRTRLLRQIHSNILHGWINISNVGMGAGVHDKRHAGATEASIREKKPLAGPARDVGKVCFNVMTYVQVHKSLKSKG
jgi:hypothetical protein